MPIYVVAAQCSFNSGFLSAKINVTPLQPSKLSYSYTGKYNGIII